MEHRTSEKYITDIDYFSNKKFERNLNESDSSEIEPFPRFIIIESNSAPITNLSPFMIEKVISKNLITVKKIKKSNSACRGGKEEICWFSTENDKVSQYQYQNLLSHIPERKGVVRSKELSLCTIEEIKRELKKATCDWSEKSTD